MLNLISNRSDAQSFARALSVLINVSIKANARDAFLLRTTKKELDLSVVKLSLLTSFQDFIIR